jgi:signal transduction histidine kinase
MTDNFRESPSRRSIVLELSSVDTAQESLDRLRLELAEVRASRERLVLAADADRRELERTLHDGVQQRLIALAVDVQLAGRLADADPAAAKTLLEEMERDVQQTLDEAAQLAQQIYPPLLEMGGLAAALRAAAASAGIPVSIEVVAGANYPAEVAGTIYLCCLAALEHAGAGARATVTVREQEGMLAFEVVADGADGQAGPDRLRDRVEALGGRLAIRSEPGGDTIRVTGLLPILR